MILFKNVVLGIYLNDSSECKISLKSIDTQCC